MAIKKGRNDTELWKLLSLKVVRVNLEFPPVQFRKGHSLTVRRGCGCGGPEFRRGKSIMIFEMSNVFDLGKKRTVWYRSVLEKYASKVASFFMD
jgi:hypothetical protein